MNGSAPKSPLTGSHAWLVKNLKPNCARLSFDRSTRMTRMNSTMAKMLQAHKSISAAKLLSAILPLPRVRKNSRMADGALSPGSSASRLGPEAAVAIGTASGTGADAGEAADENEPGSEDGSAAAGGVGR